MADDCKIGIINFLSPASTGTANYTLSGFGTPNAAIIFATGHNAVNGTALTSLRNSIGFCTASDQRAFWARSDSSSNPSSADRQAVNDAVVLNRASGGGAVDMSAAFSAFITDGITLNWTNVTITGRFVMIMLIQAKQAKILDCDNTGGTDSLNYGFRPKLVFGSSSQSAVGTTGAGPTAHFVHGYGFAIDHTPVEQLGTMLVERDNVTPSEPGAAHFSTLMLRGVDPNPPALSGGWDVSFTATGIDVAQVSSAGIVGSILALDLGAGDATVDVFDTPAATGDASVTGAGFQPDSGMILTTYQTSTNWGGLLDTGGVTGVTGTGMFSQASTTPSTNEQASVLRSIRDNQTASVSRIRGDNAVCAEIYSVDTLSSPNFEAFAKSFDSDGFTLTYSGSSPAAVRWGYVAFQHAVGGAPATNTVEFSGIG